MSHLTIAWPAGTPRSGRSEIANSRRPGSAAPRDGPRCVASPRPQQFGHDRTPVQAEPGHGRHVLLILRSPRVEPGPAIADGDGDFDVGRVAQPFGFRPHRSERAAFPHSAPPEGYPTQAKEPTEALARVSDAGRGQGEAFQQRVELLPGQSALTPPAQYAVPAAPHLVVKAI